MFFDIDSYIIYIQDIHLAVKEGSVTWKDRIFTSIHFYTKTQNVMSEWKCVGLPRPMIVNLFLLVGSMYQIASCSEEGPFISSRRKEHSLSIQFVVLNRN